MTAFHAVIALPTVRYAFHRPAERLPCVMLLLVGMYHLRLWYASNGRAAMGTPCGAKITVAWS
jgi:hypothetical protein